MPLTPADIIKHYPDDASTLQRINNRTSPVKIAVVEYNPAWPNRFQETKTRIQNALDPDTILLIQHAGSTSVPNLPAKDIIDVDLVVADIHAEETYVPQLTEAGFLFLFREPGWHEHRFFVDEGAREGSYHINLHVFGPECPEVERHRIFRDWLVTHPEDVELYARVKRECARQAKAKGESMQEYSLRKDEVVTEIRNRAFRELGWLK